jgi:hypothetical protein
MDPSGSADLMPLPAAARLIEFKLVPSASQARGNGQALALAKPGNDESADRPEPVATAFLRGRYQGLDDARTEFEAKLKAAEESFEERLAAERAAWVTEQGVQLAEKITAAVDTLTNDIGDSVAAILAPFLEEKLRVRIVEELLRSLEKVLKGGRPATLKISGPDDLLQLLRQTLGASSSAIEFEATDAVDVRVVADHTIIETQLEAWLQRISGQGE